jgi:hypothetical protein
VTSAHFTQQSQSDIDNRTDMFTILLPCTPAAPFNSFACEGNYKIVFITSIFY